MIGILVVDDHPIVRLGLISLVETSQDMRVVGEAATGAEALRLYRATLPDVVLLDLRLPDMSGLAVLAQIRKETPETKVIMLTTFSGDVHILSALKGGAHAYLVKTAVRSELMNAINSVVNGKKVYTPEVSDVLLQHLPEMMLSPSEVKVLSLIARGQTNKSIARELAVSEDAVKSRVKGLFGKLNTDDRTEAVMIGLRRGFLELESLTGL